MPYSTINDVTGLNKSANQQPLQNRFLSVQKSNYNLLLLSFKKNLHRILYIPFEKRKNDKFPLALKKVLENVISTLGSASWIFRPIGLKFNYALLLFK